MSNNSFIKTANGLTLSLNGKPYTVEKTNPNYTAVLDAIKNQSWSEIPDLINLAKKVEKFVGDQPDIQVDVEGSTITYKGEVLHNSLVDRIFDHIADGFTIQPMVNLLGNLYQNVSWKAINELYDFLEYGKMPITEDGHFLAYKRVNYNYTSCYDNKTANNIGNIVELPRYKVDDRSEVTCSYGLHICSFEYLRHYPGSRVIVVKVNPADVVSIPTDYNNTKARVCRYQVIGELTPEEAGLTSHSFGTSVYVEPDDEEEENEDYLDSADLEEFDENEWDTAFENHGSDVTDKDIAETQRVIDNLSIGDVTDLLDLSLSGQLTQDDLVQAVLKSRLNEIHKQKMEQQDPTIAQEQTSPGIDIVTITVQSTADTESVWFKFGYTNGHRHGTKKLPKGYHINLGDSELDVLPFTPTEQNIIDMNAGYDLGYKDGKGHKGRKYPRTDIDQLS